MTDIEQALAEALDAALIDHEHDPRALLAIRRDHLAAQTFRSCAAAILATEPMQAIARVVAAAYGYWNCVHDDDARCEHWQALGDAIDSLEARR